MQFQPMLASDTETVAEITAAYRSGAATPAEIVARSYARMRALNDAAVFISILDETQAHKEAQALEANGDRNLPLFGIPVAVKDNIDVRGFATTAACPDFAYRCGVDAAAVARLRQAGAIIIGKTNLDQFATGLVGVRSPYGAPRNPLDPKLVPGGSSSGSAVAVATGLVPVALGTDTAGSGRVPALFNNIVGLKPSLGLVSTAGVVPACRTLDCVSVFAHTTDDCSAVLAVMAGFDGNDPYARRRPLQSPGAPPTVRVGVPQSGQRIFFGDRRAAADYTDALDRLARLGAVIVDIDIEPFYETARLLYEGPWLAERYAATRDFIASSPQSMPSRRSTGWSSCAASRNGSLRRSTRWRCRPRRRSTRSTRFWLIRSGSIRGSAPTRTSSTCSTCVASQCRRHCILAPPAQRHSASRY